MTVSAVLDSAGRRRSPATMPGYHAGCAPRNPSFGAHVLRATGRPRPDIDTGRDGLLKPLLGVVTRTLLTDSG